MSAQRERFVPLLLFLVALVVRGGTLGLPLEGSSAVLASVGEHLGHERGWELAGHPPLLPLILAMLVQSGLGATTALRWTDVLLAALLAPLLRAVARRLGASRRAARMGGLLMALHPLGLAAVGGVAPGTGSLGALLLLAAIHGVASGRAGARRLGVVGALFLPLADPAGAIYLPALLVAYLARGGPSRWRYVLVAAACGLLLAGPVGLPALLGTLGAPQAVGALALWLGSCGLVALWLGVPRGVARLWGVGGRARPAARAWLLAGLAHGLLLLFTLESDSVALDAVAGRAFLLLPLIPLLGLCGLPGPPRRWGARLAGGALAAALVASIWLGFGGLQSALPALEPGAAGRLHLRGRAMDAAARAAGRGGWIVIDLPDLPAAEQASLADRAPGCWSWTGTATTEAGREPTLRRLLPFPAATFEVGQSVAVLARAGTSGEVHTFGGAGIYRQELVEQVGPFVVLRAQRP